MNHQDYVRRPGSVEHSHTRGSIAEAHYNDMRDGIARLLHANTQPTSGAIFETDADPDALWLAYLTSFPADERQHHNCSTCRHFIQRFGHLVRVSADGSLRSVVWPTLAGSNPYGYGVRAMSAIATRAKITQPFYSKERVYGTPVTGGKVEWTHMYARPHEKFVHTNRIKAPHQLAADKVQNFQIVRRALSEWSLAKLDEAKALLESGGLTGAHNVLPGLTWLVSLANLKANGGLSDNDLWKHATKASDAFCHPRSGAIGALMDDLMSGMDAESVKRRFAAVMNPYSYQRSTHTVSTGAINQAEKLLAASGCVPSLVRRFATHDEVKLLWTNSSSGPGVPSQQQVDQTHFLGVFDHLKPKDVQQGPAAGTLKAGSMTWAKFSAQILPMATCIEVLVPALGNFVATLTAVDSDAPPILQWDSEADRNAFSQYGYIGGTAPARWGLVEGTFEEIAGIMRHPAHWYGNASHHPESVTLIIPKMRDSKNTGSGLFPQILKQEFHPVRAVIEAHSNKTPAVQLADGVGTANGVRIESAGTDTALSTVVRVTLPTGGTVLYRIDRWD